MSMQAMMTAVIETTEQRKARERQEVYKAQVAKEQAEKQVLVDGIVAAAKEQGWTLKGRDTFGALLVHIEGGREQGFEPVYISIDRQKLPHTSKWHAATGPYGVTVGDYGERKRFPAGKNGVINYAKVAREVIERAQAATKAHAARKSTEQRIANAKQVCKRLTGSEYGGKGLSYSQNGSLEFKVGGLTECHAEALLKAAVELGIVKQ